MDTTLYTACIKTSDSTEFEIATDEYLLKRKVLQKINTLEILEKDQVENSYDFINDGNIDFYDLKIQGLCDLINESDNFIDVIYSKIEMTIQNNRVEDLIIDCN